MALSGSTTASLTLGGGVTDKVSLMRLGYSLLLRRSWIEIELSAKAIAIFDGRRGEGVRWPVWASAAGRASPPRFAPTLSALINWRMMRSTRPINMSNRVHDRGPE